MVRLGNPRSVDDRDRYGRHLRYVVKGKTDIAAKQIRKGSKARYDSLDGYDWHPKQARYRALDRKKADYRCSTTSGSGGSSGGSTGGGGATVTGGSYPPVSTYACPSFAPIKGNEGSWIYHLRRSSPWYSETTPEACFASEAAAKAAGFRRANY